jgi:hypothetical protein
MQYMLQIYTGDAMEAYEKLSEPEQQAVMAEYMAISGMPGISGGAQLQPSSTATTVRVENGRGTLKTDGPFAETKEALGGFYLFEADGLDAAIEIAARIPAARMGGAIEVRPVVER